jgi:hypothetical protein
MSEDDGLKAMGQVIQIDEARIRDHLGEMVRGTQRVAGCRSGSALRCRTLRTHSRPAGHPGRQLRTLAAHGSGRSKGRRGPQRFAAVASAVNSEGFREILGICEGAKEDKYRLVGVSAPSAPASPPFWRRSPDSGSKPCPGIQRRLGDVLGPPDRTPRQMHLDSAPPRLNSSLAVARRPGRSAEGRKFYSKIDDRIFNKRSRKAKRRGSLRSKSSHQETSTNCVHKTYHTRCAFHM